MAAVSRALKSKDHRSWPGDPPCPIHEKHTKAPMLYLDWNAWATRKAKTHRQVRCEGCGRFAIWVPKKRRGA